MIILGIDPGSRIMGYGIIEKKGSKTLHCDNGIIAPPSKSEFSDRLVSLFQGLNEVIARFNPEVLAIENICFARNVSSSIKLGHARGVAMLAARLQNLAVYEYTPLQIKQSVVGYGQADKSQVQQMVKAILGLKEIAEENASDALACALCYAHSAGLESLIKKAATS